MLSSLDWIRVADSLPDEENLYLVVHNGEIKTSYFGDFLFKIGNEYNPVWTKEGVTHWAFLPPALDEEDTGDWETKKLPDKPGKYLMCIGKYMDIFSWNEKDGFYKDGYEGASYCFEPHTGWMCLPDLPEK